MNEKRCADCKSRQVCWLRFEMNKIAVEAQNRGIVKHAWTLYEKIAESCERYFAK